MQINWSQKKSLNVKRSNKASRFLVDLNSSATKEEDKKKGNIFVEKIKQTSNKSYFIRSAPSLLDENNFFFIKAVNRLAFFSLFLFIYKFFYRVGWLFIFIPRFFYYLFLVIFQIKKLDVLIEEKRDKALVEKSKETIQKNIIKKDEKKASSVIKSKSSKRKKTINWKLAFIVFFPIKILASTLKFFYKFWVGLFSGISSFKLSNFFPTIKYSFARSAVGFAVVLLIFAIPFKAIEFLNNLNNAKGRVLGESVSAVEEMVNAFKGTSSLDFASADSSFLQASYSFVVAKDEIENINKFLFSVSKLIPSEKARLASLAPEVLTIGETSASLGKSLNEAASVFSQDDNSAKTIINHLSIYIPEAKKYAEDLRDELQGINPGLIPEEYREQFVLIQDKCDLAYLNLNELENFLEKAKIFLGFGYKKRYLLVFQNNTELRASGGFVGSYALVDFFDGEIKNLEIPEGGSYDTEAGLHENIVSPEPLHLLDSVWHFWDANWWPDWGMSSNKLEWFLEKSNGPTVDGVISFTPTVMEKLLEIIGPITLEKYNTTFTSENFWEKTQSLVEQKPDDHPLAIKNDLLLASSSIEISTTTQAELQERPKTIIADLMDEIISRIKKDFSFELLLNLLNLVDESFQEKHILLNFHDEVLQEFIQDYKWGGKIIDSPEDYLMVVNTNIGGGKSDKMIKEEIKHTASIQENGDVLDTLIITKHHTAVRGDNFTGVRNVDWMRVYVPQGSELIEVSGFDSIDADNFKKRDIKSRKDTDLINEEESALIDEDSGTRIYNEKGKTVFANWFMIDPGEEKDIVIKYKLPFKVTKNITEDKSLVKELEEIINQESSELFDSYSLYIQKQSGSINSNYSTKLIVPDKFELQTTNAKSKNWLENGKLDKDKFYYVILR